MARTIIVVITCGRCGQMWQRTDPVEDGKSLECIFCGQTGRLSFGAMPGTDTPGGRRVEAWLFQ